MRCSMQLLCRYVPLHYYVTQGKVSCVHVVVKKRAHTLKASYNTMIAARYPMYDLFTLCSYCYTTRCRCCNDGNVFTLLMYKRYSIYIEHLAALALCMYTKMRDLPYVYYCTCCNNVIARTVYQIIIHKKRHNELQRPLLLLITAKLRSL
jgi:hypothetical protein